MNKKKWEDYKHSSYLDILNELMQNILGKDLHINYNGDSVIFGNDSIPIYGLKYTISGPIKFSLYFSQDSNNIPNEDMTVSIQIELKGKKRPSEDMLKEYIAFFEEYIHRITGHQLNLICMGQNRLSFSFISEKTFRSYDKCYGLDGMDGYNSFFNLLTDNSVYTFFYISPSILNTLSKETLKNIDYKPNSDIQTYAI